MTEVKSPRLLDANFAPRAILHPSDLSVELPLRDVPTANITLPGTDSELQMRDWIELFVSTGSVGLFRVTDMGKTSDGRVAATLRHALDTLSDSVWTPAEAGTPENFDGTVSQFLTALLAQQKTAYWQMGVCEDTAQWRRDGISYARLSDLLNELVQDQVDFYPTFDFRTVPWTLNFVRLPTEITGDFRLSRNVETAEVRRSDGDMCNRLHLSASTTITDAQGQKTTSVAYSDYDNAASQALYGVIEQTANVDTAYVPDPAAWAAEFLAKRAEPAIQISIEGYELQALTGQAWDAYSRGQRVRVVLGPLNERITTRVEAITYPDALGQPERVMVELANRLPNFTSALAQMQKVTRAMGGGASRGTGRGYASASEVKEWAMVLTDVEEAVDGTGILQLWQSGIVIDAQQGVTIHSLYQGFSSQYSEIQVNKEGISTLVTKTGVNSLSAGESLYTYTSAVKQTADSVTAEVEAARGDSASLSARMSIMANQITLKVSAGDIASTLNVTAQGVLIDASKINMTGWLQAHQVTVDGLYSTHNVIADGYISATSGGGGVLTDQLKVGPTGGRYEATWKSKTVVTSLNVIRDDQREYMLGDMTTITKKYTENVTPNTETIFYLGRS